MQSKRLIIVAFVIGILVVTGLTQPLVDIRESRHVAAYLGLDPQSAVASHWGWGALGGSDTTTLLFTTPLTAELFASRVQGMVDSAAYTQDYGTCPSLIPPTDLTDNQGGLNFSLYLDNHPELSGGRTVSGIGETGGFSWIKDSSLHPKKSFAIYYYPATNGQSWSFGDRSIPGNLVVFRELNARWRSNLGPCRQ